VLTQRLIVSSDTPERREKHWFLYSDGGTVAVELHLTRTTDAVNCTYHTYTEDTDSEYTASDSNPLDGYTYSGVSGGLMDAYDALVTGAESAEALWDKLKAILDVEVARQSRLRQLTEHVKAQVGDVDENKLQRLLAQL